MHKLVSLKFITIGHAEDHLRQFYPYRAYDAEKLNSLKIPLWNPYTFGGFPYLASLRCHIFYLPNLIFLLLPTHLGMNFNYLVQIFLSGIFMYGLGKTLCLDNYCSLVSALAFMFCGFFIDIVSWGQLTMLGSSCWLPLVFLLVIKAVDKKRMEYAVGAGVIFAVQLFSGHPQMPYYGILTLFMFTFYMTLLIMRKEKSLRSAIRPSVYFLILVSVGISLAAIQLVPMAELASHSHRVLADKYAAFTRWSMELSYITTFVFPRLSAVIGSNTFPFPIALGYIGVLPLILASLSLHQIRRNKYILFFWFVVLFSLILASGRYTPIYYIFYKLVPGFAAFRNPILFIYIYVLSMSLLSGYGMAYLKSQFFQKYENKFKLLVVIILSICFVFLSIALLTFILSLLKTGVPNFGQNLYDLLNSLNSGFLNSLWAKIQSYRITFIYDFTVIAFVLGILALALILLKKLGRRAALPNTIIIFFIFFELFLYGRNFIQVYNLSPFISKRKYIDYLRKDKEFYRVLPILPYPEQDPMLKAHKIPSINGYGWLETLQTYVNFINAFQEQQVVQDAGTSRVTNYSSQAVNLLNTKYILTNKPIEAKHLKLVFTDEIPKAKTWDPFNKDTEGLKIYENKAVLPRAFIVHSAKVVEDMEHVLKALQDPKFDPRTAIILTENPWKSVDNVVSEGETAKVSFISYDETEIILKVSLGKKGFLFLSEIYYPGWKAFIDDEERKIYRANYLFRSLCLDEGEHTVRFIYSPSSFKIGVFVTLIAVSIIFIYFIHSLYKKRRPKIPSLVKIKDGDPLEE